MSIYRYRIISVPVDPVRRSVTCKSAGLAIIHQSIKSLKIGCVAFRWVKKISAKLEGWLLHLIAKDAVITVALYPFWSFGPHHQIIHLMVHMRNCWWWTWYSMDDLELGHDLHTRPAPTPLQYQPVQNLIPPFSWSSQVRHCPWMHGESIALRRSSN